MGTSFGGELFVSPKGNDGWSGKLAEPNAEATDGPLATVDAALKIVRETKEPVSFVVRLGSGTYFLDKTLSLTPELFAFDRKEGMPRNARKSLSFKAVENEQPVISGGRPITGFKEEELNGRKAWVTTLPEVKEGKWYFRQLWVNGERRYRSRLPRKGLFKVKESPKEPWTKGQDRFSFNKGDIRNWKNLGDVELCVLNYWIHDIIPIKSVDTQKGEVVLQYKNGFGNLKLASYWVENVFEALTEPGDWYLERETGKLYYLPKPGEEIGKAEVVAPYLDRIMVIEGAEKAVVSGVRFEGITFSHNEVRDWVRQSAPSPQAAWPIPGAVSLTYAQNITFQQCRIEHTGTYGLECNAGTRDVHLKRSVIRDIGAGGVKLWHASERSVISDCEIYDGGRFFHHGVGVLIGRSSGNQVIHSNIHDFDYSGISIGWNWGAGENNCFGNIIEWNHIYNIGRGMLSDMAGVYFLGVQTGTRVRFNVIHDVYCLVYGAWGFYGDGVASDILLESNIVYNTTTGSYHTNCGWNNQVRNNILAFGKIHQLTTDYANAVHSVWVENNIILYDGSNLINGPWDKIEAYFSNNLIWDTKKGEAGRPSDETMKVLGSEKGTIYADPLFVNPKKGDFRLKENSPASKVGFVPFDRTKVGPRP